MGMTLKQCPARANNADNPLSVGIKCRLTRSHEDATNATRTGSQLRTSSDCQKDAEELAVGNDGKTFSYA